MASISTAEDVARGEKRRSPAVAAVLSAVVPGAGQWYAGYGARAAVVFAPAFFLALVAVLGVRRGPTGLLELAVQPTFLRILIGANVGVLAWRVFAVVDAYVIAGERKRGPAAAAIVIGAIVIVVGVPHLVGAAYGIRGIELLESVFVADDPPAPEPLPPPPVTFTPQAIANAVPDPALVDAFDPIERSGFNLIFREGFGDPDAIAARSHVLAPVSPFVPFLPFAERVDPGRLTILLVGGDAGPGREGLRTDTMIVATVDVTTGQVALFGLPRNFRMVPLPAHYQNSFVNLQRRLTPEPDLTDADGDGIPDVWLEFDEDGDGLPDGWVDVDGDGLPDEPEFVPCRCFPAMLNKVHQYTLDWTSSYPESIDPGMDMLVDVIEHLIELPIDYFVLVDMAAFVRGVDAIGGVDVMVKEPLHVKVSSPEEAKPKAVVHVEPGMAHLNGSEALAYSRWRIGSSDYARMQRQRCLVRAAAAQADPLTLIKTFPTIADVIQTSVLTDIPLSFLPDLVNIMAGVDFDDIATVGLVPPHFHSGRIEGYPIPAVSRIRAKVQEVITEGAAAQNATGENECGI